MSAPLPHSGARFHLPNADDLQTIDVRGEAELRVPPNCAIIRVRVVTRNPQTRHAQRDNSKKARAVVAAIKSVGSFIAIDTEQVVRMAYKDIEQRERDGYEADFTLSFETHDLAKLGAAADAVGSIEGAELLGVDFSLDSVEKAAVAEKVVLMAAGFAKAKARTLAEQFGARVIAVHHLAEDSSYTQPRTYSSYGLESAALASGEPASTGTPIEPGLVQVRATVLLTVEIDHNVD